MIVALLVTVVEMGFVRVASYGNTPTDDKGNKCSDVFRSIVDVTKNMLFLSSLQSELGNTSLQTSWKPIEEALDPEVNVRAAMNRLPTDASDSLKLATYREHTRNKRSYPCLVAPGSFLGEAEARKKLLDYVDDAWSAAGCVLPEDEAQLDALLVDVCTYLGIWLGDGTHGFSSITLRRNSQHRFEAEWNLSLKGL